MSFQAAGASHDAWKLRREETALRQHVGLRVLFLMLASTTWLTPARIAAQQSDPTMRWADATLDKLERFLPDATPLGFTPEFAKPAADFKAFANETTTNGLQRKYHALVAHKNWFFNDAALYRELEDVRREKAAVREQIQAANEDLAKAHGDEMRAQEKAYAAELDAVTRQVQELFRQGKYEEGKALLAKIKPSQPTIPASTIALSKKENDLDEREKQLLAKRRSVSFRIYTNRTPSSTAPAFSPKSTGTLAGRALYRQTRGPWEMGEGQTASLVDLAVYVGPANFENPRTKPSESEAKVKCIVVWAWIESHPDTVQADEAAARRVLATIDYDGLARLIEP